VNRLLLNGRLPTSHQLCALEKYRCRQRRAAMPRIFMSHPNRLVPK
jgi:hypothetical protein